MREESLIEALQDISDIKFAVESIAYADNKIDWEQRRYEIAKSAMQGKLADHTAMSRLWHGACEDTSTFHRIIAESAVQLADALIAELKKKRE